MQSIFLELVKLSMIGSLFALAVMLVRLVFRNAPKWIFCVLWGVVALRLIVPISIESELSLVPDRLATGQIITNVGSDYMIIKIQNDCAWFLDSLKTDYGR